MRKNGRAQYSAPCTHDAVAVVEWLPIFLMALACALLLAGCSLDLQDSGCSTDDECRSNRVCQSGRCVAASESVDAAAVDAEGADASDANNLADSDNSTDSGTLADGGEDAATMQDTDMSSDPDSDPADDAGGGLDASDDPNNSADEINENLLAEEVCVGGRSQVVLFLTNGDGGCSAISSDASASIVIFVLDPFVPGTALPLNTDFEDATRFPYGCGPGDHCLTAERARLRLTSYDFGRTVEGDYEIEFGDTGRRPAPNVAQKRYEGEFRESEIVWCTNRSSPCN